MCTPYPEKLKSTFCRDSWNVAVCISLQLCQILTDFNNFAAPKPEKVYNTGHAFTYLLLKESVANDVINVSLTSLLWTTPSTSRGVICRPVSTVKADTFNITYDCYSQNNIVKMATLNFIIGDDFFCSFCCERKWTKNNSVFNWKVLLFKFTK